MAAAVSFIDLASLTLRTNRPLPNGSTSLRGVSVSLSGRWCAITHNVARFQVPTTQVEHGWMNSSALSLIDLEGLSLHGTIRLDESDLGAANPWGVGWTPDGKTICIAHSGTHEISLIDAEALIAKLTSSAKGTLIEDLDFLRGIRTRLASNSKGPRSLAMGDGKLFAANFFSDSISVVDISRTSLTDTFRLGQNDAPDRVCRGEMLFHDATLGHQHWQSCASCHPDARVDGLNWDLLNDGIGNPKNTKSLLLSHRTPPAMSLGIRETAELAVRSGFRRILFSSIAESDARAVDEYRKSLRAAPSPRLLKGQLSPAAGQGKRVFEDRQVGCAACYPAPLFTDLKPHAVGTSNPHDRPAARFDTPTLMEVWRTAPYLHDGRAATLQDVLRKFNPRNRHGRASHLTAQQINDLVE